MSGSLGQLKRYTSLEIEFKVPYTLRDCFPVTNTITNKLIGVVGRKDVSLNILK